MTPRLIRQGCHEQTRQRVTDSVRRGWIGWNGWMGRIGKEVE
jgi:hypothetical protein